MTLIFLSLVQLYLCATIKTLSRRPQNLTPGQATVRKEILPDNHTFKLL